MLRQGPAAPPPIQLSTAGLERPPTLRWLWPALAALVVTTAAGAFAAPRLWPARAAVVPEVQLGMLVLSSHPSNAVVTIDNARRGTTPLALSLAPGDYRIDVAGPNGEVVPQFTAHVTAGNDWRRHVELAAPSSVQAGSLPNAADGTVTQVSIDDVRAGDTSLAVNADLVSPQAAAWVTVTAPFEVQIFEHGRFVGTNARGRVTVSAGTHDLQLVNETLGYRVTRTIAVDSGQTLDVDIDVPMAPLEIDVEPWAEVTINGAAYGTTPIDAVPLPIGQHRVTLRHPTLGEQTQSAIVGLAGPNRLAADLRR